MKLKDIYELAVKKGMENDLRGNDAVKKVLRRNKKHYENLKEDEKKDFDLEKLQNPYSDTRILHGEAELEINNIIAGIDMEVGEILLADRLRERGNPIDLVLSHHPEGKALAGLYDVMHLQEDLLNNLGVPIGVAEGIMTPRINEVERNLLPLNHNRSVDAAKLLNFAMMCVHTPADNMVTNYLQKMFDEKEPETIEDIIDELKEIEEYKHAITINVGPKIVVGAKTNRAGKIFVDMTGGTGGSEDAFAKLSAAGVSTLVVMHIGEKHRKEAEKNHLNVVIAGHYASDSLGMNLLLDELEKADIKITACSGLYRVKR
jgi:hypothetical protein